jgi:hypothetical protein
MVNVRLNVAQVERQSLKPNAVQRLLRHLPFTVFLKLFHHFARRRFAGDERGLTGTLI